jgi:hypothetical protein
VEWDPYGDAGVAVIDQHGRAFDFLRSLDLELGLWRVDSGDEIAGMPGTVAVLAAYAPAELAAGNGLMRRRPTIALGIGLGPREASKALLFGAIGYVHDGLDRSSCQQQIADSFARIGNWRGPRA